MQVQDNFCSLHMVAKHWYQTFNKSLHDNHHRACSVCIHIYTVQLKKTSIQKKKDSTRSVLLRCRHKPALWHIGAETKGTFKTAWWEREVCQLFWATHRAFFIRGTKYAVSVPSNGIYRGVVGKAGPDYPAGTIGWGKRAKF